MTKFSSGSVSLSFSDGSLSASEALKAIKSEILNAGQKIRELESELIQFIVSPELVLEVIEASKKDADEATASILVALYRTPDAILGQLLSARSFKHDLTVDEYFIKNDVADFYNKVYGNKTGIRTNNDDNSSSEGNKSEKEQFL